MIGRAKVRLTTSRLRQAVVRRVREEAVRIATAEVEKGDWATGSVSSMEDEENLTPNPVARRLSRSV